MSQVSAFGIFLAVRSNLGTITVYNLSVSLSTPFREKNYEQIVNPYHYRDERLTPRPKNDTIKM